MPKIKCLSDEIARQIAAGEVVARPASVAKELVENSLDAQATSVTIRIEGAGVTMVEVSDNGCGMSQEDLMLAPMNFSTSKITLQDDLTSVSTYGFRGEALASIAAVSRMHIITSDTTAGVGWRLDLEGKSPQQPRPDARQRGTTVRVTDLFYNTPARRKFLKAKSTEKRKILETVLSFALIYPEIEFHYIDDDAHVFDFLAVDSWRTRVGVILGGSSMEHMVFLETGDGRLSVEGFTSLPAFTRSNRTHQFYYVNKRLVKEKTIIHAVNEAYRTVIPPGRFPVTVLALNMPCEEVDVNVHPGKLEVRVRNERAIHEIVRRSIKKSLSSHSETDMPVRYGSSPREASGESGDSIKAELPQNPSEALFGSSKIKENSEHDDSGSKIISLTSRIKNAYMEFMENQLTDVDISPHLSLRSGEGHARVDSENFKIGEGAVGEEGLFWQFNKSFIFIQVHGGLVIIDQHAAHERVIFDTSRQNLEKSISVSQQILFPIHLELSLNELDIFHSSREIFERLGFVLEPFGGKSILVRGYPQGLKNWEEGRLILKIFDDILQDRAPGDDHTDKVLASFACRSAVKAGQKLSIEEMKILADQLFAADNPYSCPHGRPTIQRISLHQIEKWFLR